jgi:hypothetical protein
VPPKFYRDEAQIRCRYCRRAYALRNRKISGEEQQAFLNSLPSGIEPIRYPSGCR